jgi:predicted transport protein
LSTLDQAAETQISNIETKTGKSRAQLSRTILDLDLAKHGEMVSWVKANWGLGHGDANTIVHVARRSADGETASDGDPLDAIYVGPKSHQRPIHECLMKAIDTFGDFEIAPKKGYVALRRKKQFAMLGPKTKDRFELGINLKDDAAHPLMKPVKPGGMCQYIISIHSPNEVDESVIAIVRRAFDASA